MRKPLNVSEISRRRACSPRWLNERYLSLADFEKGARSYLPRPLFGYISGAAEDEVSARDNRRVFEEMMFVPEILRNVSERHQGTKLLGKSYAAPFGIAPMGLGALFGYRADLALALAARDAKIPMIISGSGLIALEDVVAVNPDVWFQAYVPGDAYTILKLIDRVANANIETLVVTVDIAVNANRENNLRNGFSSPLKISPRLAWEGIKHPRWLLGTAIRTLLRHGMPHFENSYATRGAPILSRNVERSFGARDQLDWDHLRLIRKNWKGQLILKGVLSVSDAKQAVACGVDGVIVSNHGGRQLDGSVSPMRVLPMIVDAVGEIPVMIDSGFRRGADVLKAYALGARFVFVGRPFLYAAVVGEQAGVQHAITLLAEEVDRNMGLLGITRLKDMVPNLLASQLSTKS